MYFDIGSHIGEWCLANAGVPTCEKIVTVEASPWTFQKLSERCRGHIKLELLNYAVCNRNCEETVFFHAETDTLSTLNREWLTDRRSRFYGFRHVPVKCPTITLDKLIETYGVPDLIKIDVEGGEYDVISSLSRPVPLLCFEWASEMSEVFHSCIDHLSGLGFTRFYIQFKDDYLFRPEATNYVDTTTVKAQFSVTHPKIDWGMIWAMP